LISKHLEENPLFRKCLIEAMSNNTARRLRLILYLDELTPGNVIRPDNRRKLYVWYISFVEFKLHLRNEALWLPVAAIRSTILSTVVGGLSSASRALFKAMLEERPSVLLTGALVNVPDPTLLQAELKVYLGDEPAVKGIWSVKGFAGIKPCLFCSNIVKKTSELRRLHPWLKTIVEENKDLFQPNRNEDLWNAQAHLAAQSALLTKTALDTLEKACGQNFCPQGVLADRDLRNYAKPLDSQFDSMHIYWSNGIVDLEVDLMLQSLKKEPGLNSQHLETYVNSWSSASKTSLWLKDFQFKGMASQLMQLFPVLSYFLDKFLSTDASLTHELASFRALTRVVQLLKRIKDTAEVSLQHTTELAKLQREHLSLFKRAYDAETHVKPKHHFSLHLPEQINRCSCLFDCFVTERKHRLIKAEIQHYSSCATQFERDFIIRVNEIQLSETKDHAQPCLIAPKLCPLGFHVARRARLKYVSVAEGEVVFAHGMAMVVRACAEVDAVIELLVETYTFVQFDANPLSRVWRKSSIARLVPPECQLHFHLMLFFLYFLFLSLMMFFCSMFKQSRTSCRSLAAGHSWATIS